MTESKHSAAARNHPCSLCFIAGAESRDEEIARLQDALKEIADLPHHSVVSGHDSWQQIARKALETTK